MLKTTNRKIYCINNNQNCNTCVTDYARWSGVEYTELSSIDEYPNNEHSILMCSTHGKHDTRLDYGFPAFKPNSKDDLIKFISKYKGKKIVVCDDIGWGKTKIIGDITFLASEFSHSDIDELYIHKTKKFNYKFFEYTFLHLVNEKWGTHIEQLYKSTIPEWGGVFVRHKHFMTMNRYGKSHRLFLYYNLYKDNLLDKGYCSFLENKNYMDKISRLYKIDKSEIEVLNDAMNKLPITLDGDINSYRLSVQCPLTPNLALFFNSYFSVITESEYGDASFHFSEKMGKPLISFHPFIVFANPFYLQVLRDYGFKTFHKVESPDSSVLIDESYDMQNDNLKRFEMVYEQVKKMCSFSIDELHKWYYSPKISDILIHNFNQMKTISDTNLNYLKGVLL